MPIKRFVLVTGYSGAGKSSTIAFLRQTLDAHLLTGDEAVSAITAAAGYSDSLDYIAAVGVEAFTAASSIRLLEMLAERDQAIPRDSAIIDGVYDQHLPDLIRQRDPAATVILIHLSAPWEVRLARIQQRFGWDLAYAQERLKLIDDLKREAGVERMAEAADVRIVNAGQDPQTLLEEVKQKILPLLENR